MDMRISKGPNPKKRQVHSGETLPHKNPQNFPEMFPLNLIKFLGMPCPAWTLRPPPPNATMLLPPSEGCLRHRASEQPQLSYVLCFFLEKLTEHGRPHGRPHGRSWLDPVAVVTAPRRHLVWPGGMVATPGSSLIRLMLGN